jgi:hypothetical protein
MQFSRFSLALIPASYLVNPKLVAEIIRFKGYKVVCGKINDADLGVTYCVSFA